MGNQAAQGRLFSPTDDQENIGSILSSLASRWGEGSSRLSQALRQPVSPLLLSSDAGISGAMEILFGHACSSPDVLMEHLGASKRAIRPRITATTTHLDELRCPICLDVFESPAATDCRHVFCIECIVSTLVRQSICPLCRSTVYVQRLKPLAQVSSDATLVQLNRRFERLEVECPKCMWTGLMSSWHEHAGSSDCQERQSGGRKRRPGEREFDRRSVDITEYRERTGSYENGQTLPSSECSTDRLACWLIDNDPGTVVRLYVVDHRMENPVGALGGLVFEGLRHTEAVLEFEKEGGKLFVSMELFADRVGIEWQVCSSFPPLKSSAHKVHRYDGCGIPVATVVEFLLSCRHRAYNLISWNCKTFIADFKSHSGIRNRPASSIKVPRPTCFSPDLMQLLETIATSGTLPTLRPTASQRPTSPQRSWRTGLLSRLIRRSPASPAERHVQIRSVTLCLFPAEDKHRMSLRPAAQVSAFVARALDLVRPPNSPAPIASGQATDAPSKEEETANSLDDLQIRMRYMTLPILVFHIQSAGLPSCQSSRETSDGWDTVGYLSLEFRSDCGLWWHLYNEYPPGLSREVQTGGTDIVVSSVSSFPVSALQECLMDLREKEYHPTKWSGWDLVESVLHRCCPEVANQLLILPVAKNYSRN